MKKAILIVSVFIVVSLALLLSKCAIIYAKHDASARQLLVNLRKFPLPENSRFLYEHGEVGNYLSGTGDATDVLAYRIFVVDLPPKEVSVFFESMVKEQDAFDIGVRFLGVPPVGSPYLPIDSILEHIPESERNHAYILYGVDRAEEDGIWDIRGW